MIKATPVPLGSGLTQEEWDKGAEPDPRAEEMGFPKGTTRQEIYWDIRRRDIEAQANYRVG